MSPRQVLILVGIWIMVFLFLGFPVHGEQFLALVTGFIIVVIAYRLPHVSKDSDAGAIPFVEHKSGPAHKNPVPEEVVEIDIVEDANGDEVVSVNEQVVQVADRDQVNTL